MMSSKLSVSQKAKVKTIGGPRWNLTWTKVGPPRIYDAPTFPARSATLSDALHLCLSDHVLSYQHLKRHSERSSAESSPSIPASTMTSTNPPTPPTPPPIPPSRPLQKILKNEDLQPPSARRSLYDIFEAVQKEPPKPKEDDWWASMKDELENWWRRWENSDQFYVVAPGPLCVGKDADCDSVTIKRWWNCTDRCA